MSESTLSNQSLEVLGLFRVIFKSASKHFVEIEKSVGVSGAQLWALSEIANANDITVTGLANTMSLHQSTTSNLVEKLESRGFVNRIRSTEDRRVVVLQVTESGKSSLAQAPGPFRGILPDALMRMDHNELLNLKNSLNALIDLLARKSEKAAKEPLGTPIQLKKSKKSKPATT